MAKHENKVGLIIDGFSDKYKKQRKIVKKPDLYYARLLLVEYAGKDSKLTSISDYILMSIEFKEKDKILSELFEKIANDEIRHFKLLGGIIKELGGMPSVNLKKINEIKVNSIINDKCSKREIIKEMKEKEYKSARSFKRLMEISKDKSIVEMISEIYKDELQHAKMLENTKA